MATDETMAGHKHRCMRCGEEFECRSPGVCEANYDVLPNIVEIGPDGPRVVEHCPRTPAAATTNAKHVHA